MSSLQETTPPNFSHIISEISQNGLGNNKLLEESLNKVENLSSAASVVSTIMTNETNEVEKRDFFNILLRLLSSKEEYDDGFTDDLIIQLISKISSFPYIYRDKEFYELLKNALQNLYIKISENGINKVHTNIKLENSPYVSYVFAVLALQNVIKMPFILGGPANTIPTFEGLALFMNTNEYVNLGVDEQKAFNDYNMPQVIKSSLQSLSDSGKVYGLLLLQAFFHFNSEKAAESCPSLDSVLGYLKKDLLKSLAIQILKQDQMIQAIKGHEPKVAANICTQISTKSDFVKEEVDFLVNNEVFAGIDSYIEELLKRDSTVLGAVMVAHEKGLFKEKTDLINIAFPNPVKRMRVAIELITVINDPIQPIYEAMLNQAFFAYASSGETRGINNFIDVAAKNGYNECLANFLLNRLAEVFDPNVLNVFSDEIYSAISREQDPLKRVQPSDASLFYKLVCHLYVCCETIPGALKILTLYKEISNDLIKNKETKIEPLQYINAVVPTSEYSEFWKTAESVLTQHLGAVVLCVAIPNLDDAQVDSLIKAIENDNLYTPEIGNDFFTLLARNYQECFFNYLENEHIGKQVTNNIFVNIKKKSRIDNTVKTIMTVLPKSIEEKNQTFDKNEQKRLCGIVNGILPRVNISDFSSQISELGRVFNVLPDITPEEEEYNTFIDAGFIQQYPTIFRRVENKDDLSKNLLTNYAAAIVDQKSFANELQNTKEREKLTASIEDATDVLFSMNPQEEILLDAYNELFKKNLNNKTQATISYKYPVFIEKLALAAEKNKVSLTLPQFSHFMTIIMSYTISKDEIIREAAHNAFASLFNVEHKPSVVFTVQRKAQEEEEALVTQKFSSQPASNEQIYSGSIDLFERCQVNISDELLKSILDHIIIKKIYNVATCLFLRAICQKKEKFASSEYSNRILKFFLAQPGMTTACQFQFDKGVLALAERSLKDFVEIFLLSKSSYRVKIANYILCRVDLRDTFIETLFICLVKSKDIECSLGLFDILKLIVNSEGIEICPKSFAMLISCIIMWMGALFEQNTNKKINLIKLTQSLSNLSTLVDEITSRTVIASSFNISVSVNDISKFALSHRSLANAIESIQADELEILFGYVDRIITSSPNQPFILSASLFSISMDLSRMNHCIFTDNLLTKVILTTVVHGLEKIYELEYIESGLMGKIITQLRSIFCQETKDINEDILNLFIALENQLKDHQFKSADQFRAALLSRTNTFSKNAKCELKESSVQIIKSLKKIHIDRIIQKRIGSIDSGLRFSILWNDQEVFDESDIDAHAIEPDGNEIYYSNRKNDSTGGILDTDIIHPNKGVPACENITWPNLHQMKDGTYRFFAHQCSDKKNSKGFKAVIKFEGVSYYYDYESELKQDENIDVAKVTLKNGSFSIDHCIPFV